MFPFSLVIPELSCEPGFDITTIGLQKHVCLGEMQSEYACFDITVFDRSPQHEHTLLGALVADFVLSFITEN